MGGWIPTDAAGWPAIAEALSSTGAAWPEAAAITDLRWWIDRAAYLAGLSELRADALTAEHRATLRAGLPGRPTLARRWGWTDWAVRTLLRSSARWWDRARWGVDPGDHQVPTSPTPATRQPPASPPPAGARMDADDSNETASHQPAHRQPTASEPPSRGSSHHNQHPGSLLLSAGPEPTAGCVVRLAGAEVDPGRAAALAGVEASVAELLALQQAEEPQHGTGHGRDQDAIRRALGRGTPAGHLAALWAWSGVADDPLVAGSRSGGWRRWSALLKAPTGPERVAAAVAWDAAGRPAPGRPPGRAGAGASRGGSGGSGFVRGAAPPPSARYTPPGPWPADDEPLPPWLLELARAELGDLVSLVDPADVAGLLEEEGREIAARHRGPALWVVGGGS